MNDRRAGITHIDTKMGSPSLIVSDIQVFIRTDGKTGRRLDTHFRLVQSYYTLISPYKHFYELYDRLRNVN